MTFDTKQELLVTLRDITRQLMAVTYAIEQDMRREDAMFERILAEIREQAPEVGVTHDFAPPPDGVRDEPPSRPA